MTTKIPADSVVLAEQQVAAHKTMVRAQYGAVQARLRRQASSTKLIGAVLGGAIAIGYLAMARRTRAKPVTTRRNSSAWLDVLATVKALLPLAAAIMATLQARAALKATMHATGAPSTQSEEAKGRDGNPDGAGHTTEVSPVWRPQQGEKRKLIDLGRMWELLKESISCAGKP